MHRGSWRGCEDEDCGEKERVKAAGGSDEWWCQVKNVCILFSGTTIESVEEEKVFVQSQWESPEVLESCPTKHP